MSRVRRHVVKKEPFSASKFTEVCIACSDDLSAKRSADTVMFNFILMGYNLSAAIPHLQELHGMSYDEIKAGIGYIRKVVDDPANDPFVGWELHYKR